MTQDMKIGMILHTIAEFTRELYPCENSLTREILFPRWEQNIPTLGSKYSHTGNKKTGLRLALDEITARRQRDYGSCPTRLRFVVLILLMLVMGVSTSWGQTGTDYSGTWYIASNYRNHSSGVHIYDPLTTANNYYLCPTEGWYYYKATDDFYPSNTNEDNKTMPFLTTFKCKGGSYHNDDPSDAVWTITKHDDYYSFQQKSTGKYMVFSGQISTTTNADRMRVHLEEVSGNLPDNALFSITTHTDGVSIIISPISILTDHLTVNGGNSDYLIGKKNDGQQDKKGGPSDAITNGIIGIYRNNQTDDAKYFYLEDYITRPTITYNDANDEITITAVQLGATLIYTTDGSTPTTSNGTPVNNTTITFNPSDGATTIKAVAVVNGELSNIATFTTPFYLGSNHKYLIQSQNNAWNTTNFHFYMIPGDEENSVIKLNTTSLFRPTMEWYFLDAGDGYCYIVNNSAKDNSNNPYYLCYDATNKVYMETYSEDNKFKFSIVESPTAGTFNIIPYGLSSGDRFVFKSSGNANANAIGLTNSNTSENARWKFIASNALDKNAPYSASNATSSSYYKIASVGDNTYYIVPPSGNNTNATASNSNDVALVKSGIWYFEEAQAPTNNDWLTYYYIRNAETSDYLYFTKDANNAGACLATSNTITEGSESRYMFTWAKTADSNINYYIIPKNLKDISQNQFSALQRDGNTLKTNLNRGAGNYAWTFESTTFKCETPAINYNPLTGTISITCGTPGATIYVAHYNSEPSSSDIPELVAGNVYNGEFDALPGYYKAVASRSTGGDDMSDAATSELIEEFHCTRPIITKRSNHVTITCATPGATIYYIAGSGEFSENAENYGGTLYTESGFDTSETVIKAIAVKGGVWSTKSAEALYDKTPTTITSGAQITNMDGVYIVGDSFTPSSSPIGSATDPFTGEFDGNFKTFELSHPLFAYVSGASIKNVIISNANNISTSANAGVIANVASGDTRIYNCGINSGSVSGSNNVGGIVGSLDGSSRVINCYSYANITGGTNKGGIVGYNSYASKSGDIRTMVMNCMFYGDISSGGTISPIYGGELIDNQKTDSETGLNNYNYYRYESDYSYDNLINKYNNALAAKEEYLNRFEFYRQMLNSNKKLAAYYATGSANNANQKMAKWVLETADRQNSNPYPYPILKPQAKYPSIINYDAEHATQLTLVNGKPSEADRNKGGKISTLTVNIAAANTWTNAPANAGINNGKSSLTLVRTDKDEDHFNFNYDKVQLPYYNDVGTNNYTDNKVVTGWKITGVTIGSGDDVATQGSYSASDSWGGYNFADRKTYAKDLYSVSGRVFSQGAYFDVPYGATAITIEPYWGNAAYISDEKLDVIYNSGYSSPTDILESQFTFNNGTATGAFNGQNVYSNISTALNTLSGSTVYDNALVLVGNRHLSTVPANDSKHFTIMSVDEDHDNEPDYSLIYHHDERKNVSPIRFDFLNVMGTAQAQKPDGATKFSNVGIFNLKGWFEVTNTTLMYFSQIEYDNGANKAAEPLILLGGVVDQIVSNHENSPSKTTTYIHLGSNVRFKQFSNGCHSDKWDFTKHIPISVTGGDYQEFYLSGMYRPDAVVNADNAECYISSGRFGELAGAGQQMINGNVQWQIYNADINNFYGGGINAAYPITGNITVNLYNSHIGTYCGGPKFGNMQKANTSLSYIYASGNEGKTPAEGSISITGTDRIVTTEANGCTFGSFFGAGYGGTSYNRVRTQDNRTVPANFWEGDYTGARGFYSSDNNGIATDFDYDFFVWSTGQTGGRFYVKYASLSTAQTNNVTSTLTNCIVNGNVYGGGKLGRVAGKATTTLNGCTVNGDVFGAGYSGALEPVKVRDGGFGGNPVKYPSVNTNSGMFEDGEFSGTTDYIWKEHALTNNASNITTEGGKNYIYTDVDLDVLGQVDDAELEIQGNTNVTGSVYGGGEEANVNNDTEISISGGTVNGNVFGGGKGTADEFTCAKAMVGVVDLGVTDNGENANPRYTLLDGGTTVSITNGTVKGNVYGGGEVGRVERNTLVEIGSATQNGTPIIEGSVFGAGAGVTTHGYSALVRGNTTVTIQGTAQVWKNVYGGGEKASVGRYYVASSAEDVNTYHVPIGMPCYLKAGGKCTVNILGSATIGTDNNENTGHVFGAGQGVDPHAVTYTYQSNETKPSRMKNDNTWEYFGNESAYLTFVETLARASETDVNISGGTIKGSVFGGSESGFVYHSTDINIQNGTINGNVFGGGKGLMTYAEAGRVRENTKVTMSNGAVKGNVYGGGSLGDVGRINKTLSGYNYKWTDDAVSDSDATDKTYTYNNTGLCEVIINGGTIGSDGTSTANHASGHVFGAGKGATSSFYCEKAMVYKTNVSITKGTIYGNVYGGGEVGRVENNAVVSIEGTNDNDTDIKGGIFGAGAGVETHGYSALLRGDATVTIQGKAKVGMNVYGGGEAASVGRFKVENSLPKEPLSGGTCTVTIQGDAKIGTGNTGGSVYGACKGVEPGDYSSATHVISDGTSPGFANNAEYLAFLQTLALTSNTIVTIAGNASVNGSVYGGGRRGITLGRVQISMTGGTVNQDVYGGGALADTNTGNWNADYGSVAGITAGTTIVTGYYTRSGAGTTESPYAYTKITAANTTAAENTTYYSRNSWAHATLKSAYYTTTVNLTGGIIRGDVYGGGLGRQAAENVTAVEATVYGDVTVNLNDNNGTCYVDGSVFGCNNTNGSPKGDVEVHIYNTVHLEGNNVVTTAPGTGVYELKAVYGGGKKAEYNGTDRTAKVYIETCDPSIEEVYGGGFGADVPNTYVEVKGAHEIHYVFGGGYGADTQGFTNPGANVNGTTEVLLKGGTVHEVYGGSNTKGNITGGTNVNVSDESNENCPLTVEHIYGGGKNANMSGSANIILGCQPDAWIEDIYAGSREADVEGDVSLTITSGKFERVFGGNKTSGKLKGSITLNIEETGDCSTPIIIGELYAGGNEADYSIYGYYQDAEDENKWKPRTRAQYESWFATLSDEDKAKSENQIKANPQLNVRAFTSIGAIYGGGYSAKMYADPTVSINVVKGSRNTTVIGEGEYTPNTGTFHHLPYPAHASGAIGTIGYVYGGGNLATVHGSTTVNIGTESHIYFKTEPTHLGTKGTDYIEQADGSFRATVEGANITGNVYGGGNLADVTGNTQINVCAVYDEENDKYDPVAEGASKVTIGGDIFGGGKGEADNFFCNKAMVGTDGAGADAEHYPNYADGNTTIIIGNGTVNGNVYGGGEVGRVEMNTSVTVGLGDGVASGGAVTSAPEIIHSVFGGGKGVKTHGYSALVRGNPTVTIQGNAKVRDNVYGGGEIASVARYNVPRTQAQVNAAKALGYDAVLGMPYALKDVNSGSCTVTIQGYAEIGPETIGSDNTTSIGHVFGAGKGIVPGGTYAYQQGTTKRMVLYDGDVHTAANTHWEYVDPTHSDTNKNVWEKFADEAAYITFVQTLALSSRTNVTIDGNAKVKGSVFGGSESGFVQFNTNVNVEGGTIGVEGKGGADFGNVYGGGKGDVVSTGENENYVAAGIVKGNTKVLVSQASGKTTKIYHNVYGGGAYGTVGEFVYGADGLPTGLKTYTVGETVQTTEGGKTEIYITGGTIGTNGDENGMIFGSSRGDVGAPGSIHDKAAWVYDTHVAIGDTTANATITTTTPLIKGSVYGGGENGHNFHNAYVRINGGTIGITEGENLTYTENGQSVTKGGAAYPYRGNVYGGGCGTDKYNNNTLYNPLAGIVQGNAIVNITAGNVVHNVYGAGAMGSVGKTVTTNDVTTTTGGKTTISIGGGTIGVSGTVGDGNIFGAARGNLSATGDDLARVRETSVTVSNGTVKGNVYGGGQLGDVGTIDKTDQTNYNYTWKKSDGNNNTANNNKITSHNTNTGICTVTISGGTIGTGVNPSSDGTYANGNVFGAGKGDASTWWCERAIAYATNVSVTKGTVYGNVYGGGELGRVEDDAKVTIGTTSGSEALTITGSVYGAGAGIKTHGYSALVRGNSDVLVQGVAQIGGSVYGGGEIASVGRFKVIDGLPSKPQAGGTCTVTIQGSAKIGTSGTEHNVFGACKGVTPTYNNTLNDANRTKSMQLYANRPKDANGNELAEHTYWDYYETYPNNYAGPKFVWVYYPTKEDYLDFLRTLALTSNTHVTIGGSAEVHGSVFGGGERGVTLGGVDVNMTGGTVFQDVYGGGSLADSNRAMWDATNHKRYDYVELIELIDGLSVVTGYYTKSGDTYTLTNDVTAQSGTTYYAKYKTNVNLTGGMIKGDAYGGGLGQLGNDPIEAMVYGDVSVNQGTLNDESAATAYTISYLTDNSEPAKQVVNSGRIFGCNNLNGSPKGNVTVTVYGTVTGKDASGNNLVRTTLERNETTHVVTSVPENHTYEVAAVYGGGNLADYAPADGDVKVRISSCDVSVEEVYGGGNAARVPSTDVLVTGAHEIEHVFGGGNGEDKYYLNGEWHDNPGADIDGDAITLLKGGLIHEAYGGSNEKGTITGDITIDTGTGGLDDCPVKVDKLVGAGKNADVNGNLIIVLGCYPTTKTPLIFAGADNANVNGDVELTITSGTFGKVFGGNNEGGAIKGHIILNIEETGCNPIVIDELYLGGNEAAYSRYGYYLAKDNNGHQLYRDEEQTKPLLRPRTSATDEHMPVQLDDTEYTNISDFEAYAQPVLNVVSCTSIGEVFGGGYGEGGTMYADPTVNINMISGEHATALGDANKLGAIGNVYGGGNAAAVYGDATVNIGTEGTVLIHKSYDKSSKEYDTEIKTVTGANITGNVYGGGKKADVGKTHLDTNNGSTIDVIDLAGNTFVNICAKYNTTSEKWESVTEGTAKVKIGGSVFGGGEGEAIKPAPNESVSGAFRCGKAMVTGSTNVMIGNGTVTGSVYGGGEIGRVEKNTAVTIGIKLNENEGASTTVNAPNIKGDVFGAGKGVHSHGYAALVRGNTNVIVQGNAKVGECVYGGGKIASVGRYNIADSAYHATHPKIDVGMPYSLANDTSGNCVVIVRDNAEVGPDNMQMKKAGGPDDTGYVFGAGKGILPYEGTNTTDNKPGRVKPDNTWQDYSGTAVADTTAYLRFIETQGLATQTDVTITGNAFIKGSVYGGSFNGHVQHDTHVTIAGDCQIGAGYDPSTQKSLAKYSNWPTDASEITTSWKECAHWDYDPNSGAPFDMYANYSKTVDGKVQYYYDEDCTKYAEGGCPTAKDGHTFYGNVFGGGSGYIPYAPGKWHREAGSVGGNTQVDITGGHILTSVYGGNEQTDVGTYQDMLNTIHESGGKCTINMTGGTIGVPRTVEDMMAHPVTCYLFGAGKGDQRINFNTWTNVMETEVNISGDARIYGSVFGGGEDGHVISNAVTNIGGTVTIGNQSYTPTDDLIIGTTGTSYVDGNVFGGGRGFSGDAQTAGTVGGNIRLNISGGKMLGSIYGGGRLASVGTQFAQPVDPDYGQFEEDDNNKTYGHVTVNISGCTIGNESGNAVSGNVFGGSMGRLTLLDNTINPLWPELAQVKSATVNITQPEGKTTLIKRNVYGGGEYGTVRENTYVTIGGTRAANGTISPSGKPTINGSVYGGGYGSDDYGNPTTVEVHWNNGTAYYTYTPMQWAGCVGGNTNVNVVGGQVKQNVYGGGQLASVGIIDYSAQEDANGISTYNNKKYSNKNIEKHADIVDEGETKEKVYGFGLSWPYKFTYVACNPDGFIGGKTTVNVTGGRIGTGWDDGTGYVFGAGKGKAFERYTEAFCANVRETEVNINYGTTAAAADVSTADCIASAVYGGGEDGHVYENTAVNITGGLIGLSVYGGGKGEGTYKGKLRNRDGNHDWNDELVDLPSWTAGKVYGNTSVNMSGGHVLVNIYGGGNMGSVGKGNYASGTDDYYLAGYGETLTNEGLWTSSNNYNPANPISTSNKPATMADYFLGSGKCTVNITGGTVGTKNTVYGTVNLLDQKTPTGMVFGGSRGRAAEDIGALSPRYAFAPDFFLGYVNSTAVTIGDSNGGPTIYSQVFGGGRDGHVRNSTHVIINNGTIGQAYAEYNSAADGIDKESQRRNCGNVYGSGSGMGTWNGTNHGTSSGSVTRNTTVDINGGNIYGNVYGGGAMSSVGPPKITMPDFAVENWSKCTVNINGGNIGVGTDFSTYGYGGCVFGASRGGDLTTGEQSVEGNLDNYATTLWNEVNIKGGTIAGDVYGGGQAGRVKKDNKVILTGGTVAHDVYGGGMGTSTIAANVGGNTTVTLNGTAKEQTVEGQTQTVYLDNAVVKGSVFGANNVNGTPKGHVTVHVYKTAPAGHSHGYDVTSVFGGGKQADYVPTDNVQSTEVIIEGCDLTSIQEVYGGGYGAATPGTNVLIKGTKIINEVYGGGYGAGDGNPGANVGYLTGGADYTSGNGKAIVQLMAGKINDVYGGSNTLGDIRGGASITNVTNAGSSPECCAELEVGKIYGGGKDAEMTGGTEIVLGCMPNDWIGEIYAGAQNADVNNDVSLTLTSGKFGRVFGGNKSGGKLDGGIVVNIEENPECDTPLIIGELYGGGNEAPYSAYGYKQNDTTEKWIPLEKGQTDALETPYPGPIVNVKAFTSIGNIYGGGYGATAKVVGNPTIYINEVLIDQTKLSDTGKALRNYEGEEKELPQGEGTVKVKLYPHTVGKMGVIGNVFGGGNAAEVIGNTNVNIGTESSVKFESQTDDTIEGSDKRVSKTVVGADIKGNVYGGGNNAKVTGNTNVVIGQEKVTTTTP